MVKIKQHIVSQKYLKRFKDLYISIVVYMIIIVGFKVRQLSLVYFMSNQTFETMKIFFLISMTINQRVVCGFMYDRM